jgi:hypothetical protein
MGLTPQAQSLKPKAENSHVLKAFSSELSSLSDWLVEMKTDFGDNQLSTEKGDAFMLLLQQNRNRYCCSWWR